MRSACRTKGENATGMFKLIWTNHEEVVVSFDLFGTLIDASTPSDPADAVAAELSDRGVSVPGDWSIAYRESHVDLPAGVETSLPAHVARALRSRGIEPDGGVVRRAVAAAFDPEVTTRPGASGAIEAAVRRGDVGLCSNCSVPGLATRALARSDVRDVFGVIVTSVACGWRKPDSRAFEAVSSEFGASPSDLIHVGDDPATDGGVEAAGGTFIDVNEVPLTALPERLGDR